MAVGVMLGIIAGPPMGIDRLRGIEARHNYSVGHLLGPLFVAGRPDPPRWLLFRPYKLGCPAQSATRRAYA